ncbi:hypothetical protein [Neobacillus niacini]|uniref:hypothetical protein n=1 Tax=Neobacillus niacini TaxID=86668 RepID=UPI0021CB30BD|nr:hypothetical protein [Neobacillus niacini]MCM3763458.1 hypothetical protein [Neobacillus niacini]
MKIEDRLSNEQKQQLNNIKSPKKKKQEKVNWPEIMGMNRDIYTRKNGAVRRK